MSTYNLLNFGNLDLEKLEEYYNVEVKLNGRSVEVDLNFEETTVDRERLEKVSGFIADLTNLDKMALEAIHEDYKTGDTVKEYIEHHLEELDKKELNKLFKGSKKELSSEERMLSVIKLKRVGFYPHNEEEDFITLDYTIDQELTDYLVVLNLTEKGKVDYITMES